MVDGDIRDDVDPAVASRLLFGMVNSIVEWYKPDRGLGCEEIADTLTRIAFEGMRSSRTRNEAGDHPGP